jgi:hypothetical protein
MKLGNKILILLIKIFFLITYNSYANEEISSSQLINIEKIKPSFEEIEEKNESSFQNQLEKDIKQKRKKNKKLNSSHAILIGLDKITAKSSEILVNLNETKNFGPLEIKILKCKKVKANNKVNDVAYMQVKDLTKTQNEKVFIFNGWTFSDDPNLTPFDHAIYDIQLLNCYKT